MFSKKVLETHYAEYAARPEGWVLDRAKAKEEIVRHVLNNLVFQPAASASVAVLGASDKRYVGVHQLIFEKLLHMPVSMTTLDIDVAHLAGEHGVVFHDVTDAFPLKYDIVFSHSLMKFLTPDEQVRALENSFNALTPGGFAMHIMHSAELEGVRLLEWQHTVNLPATISELQRRDIPVTVFDCVTTTQFEWLRKTTVLVTQR